MNNEELKTAINRFNMLLDSSDFIDNKILFHKFKEFILKKIEPKIQRIEIEYSGYNDSGGVDTIAVYSEAMEIMEQGQLRDIPSLFPTLIRKNGKTQFDLLKTQPLKGFIEDFIEISLPGGWEVNEGSQGMAYIYIHEEGKDIIDHEENILTQETERIEI